MGAALLLLTPSDTFEKLAPWLIAGRLAGDPRPAAHPPAADRPEHRGLPAPPGIFVVAVYGGYFGAAAGVMLLAIPARPHRPRRSPRSNALKNIILGIANAVAAVAFALFGDPAAVATALRRQGPTSTFTSTATPTTTSAGATRSTRT